MVTKYVIYVLKNGLQLKAIPMKDEYNSVKPGPYPGEFDSRKKAKEALEEAAFIQLPEKKGEKLLSIPNPSLELKIEEVYQ